MGIRRLPLRERGVVTLEERMEALIESGDPEIAHSAADELLLEALREIGRDRLVELWWRVPKWYA